MRATVMYGAGDVRVEDVPDPRSSEPTDALVRDHPRLHLRQRSLAVQVDGADRERPPDGARVHRRRRGRSAPTSARSSRATSSSPRSPAPTAPASSAARGCRPPCLHGGWWGGDGVDGGQGEAVRVPQADGTLVMLPVGEDDALMPSLLTLSDVMGTGHHAAVAARVAPARAAAVVGDGAVGLCGVIAAKRLGAERIILLGRHPDRIELGPRVRRHRLVGERGDEAVERVKELTGGLGVHSVLECVGPTRPSRPRSGSRAPGAPSAGSVSRSTSTIPPAAPTSTTTSRSAAAPPLRAPTSRSCCPTSSTADRARPGLRPDRRPRRRPGWLPGDGRPRVDQGPDRALTEETQCRSAHSDRPGGLGDRARLHGHELRLRPAGRRAGR